MSENTVGQAQQAPGDNPLRTPKRKAKSALDSLINSGQIDPIISMAEFAQALSINVSTFKRKVDAGAIKPGFRVTEGRVGWPASYIKETLAKIKQGQAIE